MIGIRVDANKEIASGHVMRCISIGLGLRRVGLKCIFINADLKSKEIISSYGFEMICLNSQWDRLDKEIDLMVEVIQQYRIDKLIVDTYYVTSQYLITLEAHTKVIYIDDMNFFKYPVSMVINYNIYHALFAYEEMYKDSNTQLLLGCDFVPLRGEFLGIIPLFRDKVRKVLITTGGADQYNIAGKLINKILEGDFFNGIEFNIVVGKLNRNEEYLKDLTDGHDLIVLQKDVENMAKLMVSCDLAITAGGSTIYELCACGIPSISFSFADNQLYGVEGFEKAGIIAYAGDIRDDEEICLINLIGCLKKYVNDVENRKEKSFKMKKIVDGNGVKRIVKAIIEL